MTEPKVPESISFLILIDSGTFGFRFAPHAPAGYVKR